MAQAPRRRPAAALPESPPEQEISTARGPEKKIGPFTGGVAVSVWMNTVQTEHGPRSYRAVTTSLRR